MKKVLDAMVKKVNELNIAVNTPIETSAQEANLILKSEVKCAVAGLYELLAEIKFLTRDELKNKLDLTKLFKIEEILKSDDFEMVKTA